MKNDKFIYHEGELQIAKTQCEFCKFNDKDTEMVCKEYLNGKPNDVITNKIRCPKFKDKNSFFEN